MSGFSIPKNLLLSMQMSGRLFFVEARGQLLFIVKIYSRVLRTRHRL
jgi:hypothetical protein